MLILIFSVSNVKQSGEALEFADESLKRDSGIVRVAVKQSAEALHVASEELRKDPEVKKLAMEPFSQDASRAESSLKTQVIHVEPEHGLQRNMEQDRFGILKKNSVFANPM